MVNFGDELIIDSYRIPWLIWIQLVVMFLLIILLYFFSSDQSLPSTTASSSSATPFISSAGPALASNSQVRENQITKEPGSGANREIERREDIHETEGSAKDGTSSPHFAQAHHPCHFLGLAKQAFLKCLGLEFSESSSNSNQRKEH